MIAKRLGFIFLFSLFLLLPTYSYAAVLYSQSDASLEGNYTHLDSFAQRLGTNLSGTASGVGLKYHATQAHSSSNLTLQVRLFECPSSSYSGCSMVATSSDKELTYASNQIYFNDFSSSYVLDSSKYYFIGSYVSGGTNCSGDCVLNFYGSSSNNYVGGIWAGTASNLVDAYFVLYSPDVFVNGGVAIQNPNPVTGSTTISTVVNFSFNYLITGGLSLGTGKIKIQDLTLPATYYSDFLVASSGPGIITKQVTLSTSHTYKWSVCFYDSSLNPYCPSDLNTFNVVGTSSPIISNPSSTVSSSTVSSSTIVSTNVANQLPSSWSSVLSTKFPFSYIFDATVLFSDLANGSASGPAKYTLPLGAVFTNPSNNVSTTSIVLIDPTAITATGYLTQIRSLISYCLYFLTGLYSFHAIMGVI